MNDVTRSNRREVRNPILGLPEVQQIKEEMSSEERERLARILTIIAKDASDRAQRLWKSHKAPMAAYWKAKAVDARHLARAVRS